MILAFGGLLVAGSIFPAVCLQDKRTVNNHDAPHQSYPIQSRAWSALHSLEMPRSPMAATTAARRYRRRWNRKMINPPHAPPSRARERQAQRPRDGPTFVVNPIGSWGFRLLSLGSALHNRHSPEPLPLPNPMALPAPHNDRAEPQLDAERCELAAPALLLSHVLHGRRLQLSQISAGPAGCMTTPLNSRPLFFSYSAHSAPF